MVELVELRLDEQQVAAGAATATATFDPPVVLLAAQLVGTAWTHDDVRLLVGTPEEPDRLARVKISRGVRVDLQHMAVDQHVAVDRFSRIQARVEGRTGFGGGSVSVRLLVGQPTVVAAEAEQAAA